MPLEEDTRGNEVEQTTTESSGNIDDKECAEELERFYADAVRTSLGWESDRSLEDFDTQLRNETRELERYRKVINDVSSAENTKDVQRAVFESLRRSNDPELPPEVQNGDGVLMQSMKQGKFECAGRTLVASVVFEDLHIPHSVISAAGGGHYLILAEVDEDTLAYFDANADMYYTFPKSALQGYKGTDRCSRCTIGDYETREKDVQVGQPNFTITEFWTLPPKEGTSRSYLGNVSAAMNGNREFENSPFQVRGNSDGEDGVIRRIVGEEDPEYAKNVGEENLAKTQKDMEVFCGQLLSIHTKFPRREDFIRECCSALTGDLGKPMPFLKGAGRESARVRYAEMAWKYLNLHASGESLKLPRVI